MKIFNNEEQAKPTREDYLRAYAENECAVQYNDAWVGWTIAKEYSVKTARLEYLRMGKVK
jgi:hypothetical protein